MFYGKLLEIRELINQRKKHDFRFGEFERNFSMLQGQALLGPHKNQRVTLFNNVTLVLLF